MSEYTEGIEEPDEDVTCKRCGQEGLFWRCVTLGVNMLFEDRPNGSIAKHECNFTNQFEETP